MAFPAAGRLLLQVGPGFRAAPRLPQSPRPCPPARLRSARIGTAGCLSPRGGEGAHPAAGSAEGALLRLPGGLGAGPRERAATLGAVLAKDPDALR